MSTGNAEALAALADEIASCFKCPRLVAWREQVAREKRASFANEEYWGRPVPGFGDPAARLLVAGLAPAAHGGNRTGRVFTGDRSGDWLFASMYRTGWANQPQSVSKDDALELLGAYVGAAVRCAPPANKPTTAERDTCLPYLIEEMRLLTDLVVIVALGAYAWDAVLRAEALEGRAIKPKPRFSHGAEAGLQGVTLIGSYHPSQQNTFTGVLTEEMLDAVFHRARELVGPG